MLSHGTLLATAALMALVAVACTVLSLVWTIPAWRRSLAADTDGMTGWSARLGSGLVSTGIAASALVAWHGVYWTVTAL